MSFQAIEMIKKRKSVRTFDGNPLRDEDRAALLQYIQTQKNPFDVPIEFKLLNVKDHNISSPVIIGTDEYIAAKGSRCNNFELGYGYSFEAFCLFAESLGIGTVILAASISRNAFEKAMNLQDNEVMPVATPIGYPAAKRSIRESLMRTGLKADNRIDFDKLFFDGDFNSGLSMDNAGIFGEALEMLRWAPSATNKQPWRAVVSGDTVHFYEEKTIKDSTVGDIQKVDMGIALAHFDLTLQEKGISGRFVEDNPGVSLPDNVHYIVSYKKDA